ncbi:MAG: transglutaminase-like domain-containing protein [Firmicutes bacterium]|nr:transglutaminase-like domain-containing protein [Bacillota bacterium]
MRWLTAFAAVLGLTLFFCDAFRIEINPVISIDFSAITAASAAALCFGFRGVAVWLGSTLLSLFITNGFSAKGLVKNAYYGVIQLFNIVSERISKGGFAAPDVFPIDDIPIEKATLFAVFILAALLSLAIVPFTVKRARLIVPSVVIAFICILIFTYNLSEFNLGFAIIIAAICGMLVLRRYDSIYIIKGTFTSPQVLSGGGKSAVAAMLAAAIAVSVPAAVIKEPLGEIDLIKKPIELARNLLTMIISEKATDIELINAGISSNFMSKRTSWASDRNFAGEKIMEVRSDSGFPVYLRGWVGGFFDGNNWSAAIPKGNLLSAEALNYSYEFYDGFTPDIFTYSFAESLTQNRTNTLETLGYKRSKIQITMLSREDTTVFLPSVFDPVTGIVFPETDDREAYSFFYEGMITSKLPLKQKIYAASALIPTGDLWSSYNQVIDKIDEYSNNLLLIDRFYTIYKMRGPTYGLKEFSADLRAERTAAYLGGEIENDIYAYLTEKNISVLIRFIDMTDAQKEDFYFRNIELRNKYETAIKTWFGYTEFPESEIVRRAAESAIGAASETDHENISTTLYAIRSVIEYLSENCRYSLTPVKGDDNSLTAIESFLSETKEGYCVQFASAAAAMLRYLGYTVRYVEGYVADGFKLIKDESGKEIYTSTVTDENAHAWIEVYIDGMGWRQFETTPRSFEPSIKDTETAETTTGAPDTSAPVIETTAPKETTAAPAVPNPPDDKQSGPRVLVIAAVIIASALTVFLIIRRKNSEERFKKLCRAAKSGALTEAETLKLGKKLAKKAYRSFIALGVNPAPGELPVDYLKRVDSTLHKLRSSGNTAEKNNFRAKDGYRLLEKAEYGSKLTRDELCSLSVYAFECRKEAGRLLKGFRRFFEKYVALSI